FAALTSSISLVETCTSIIADGTKCTRRRALVIVIAFITVMGIIVNMGYSSLSFIQPMGEGSSILDFLDFISNSVMMPIAALLTCIFVGWIIGPKVVIDEVRESAKFKLAGVWTVMVKYIAPVVLVVILVAYAAQTLGLFSMWCSRGLPCSHSPTSHEQHARCCSARAELRAAGPRLLGSLNERFRPRPRSLGLV
ncbi:MAG: hypothetical protein ACLT98_18615, partial [Eggerthellaceae bacterium]